MPNIRGPELLILVLVVVLLFGAKRLPAAARSVGRSLRIFKAETKGLIDSDAAPTATTTADPAAPAALPPVDRADFPIPTPLPPAQAAPGNPAVGLQSDAAPSSLQSQPPSQA